MAYFNDWSYKVLESRWHELITLTKVIIPLKSALQEHWSIDRYTSGLTNKSSAAGLPEIQAGYYHSKHPCIVRETLSTNLYL